MLFLYGFLGLSWLCVRCRGTPTEGLRIPQGPGAYYAITGPGGGFHPRLEIRVLERNPVMWNLLLLAMRNFQAMDQNEMDSYYQIAGIHGMPWYDWDGVTFNSSSGEPPEIGYCPHHDLLFSTWHRPYLLLFEQKLQALAYEVANEFGDPSYQDAANRLRLPYWDWAQAVPVDQPIFPAALSTPTVLVTLRDGSTQEIDNPLHDYQFHPLDNTQINSTGCDFSGNAQICQTSQRTVRRAISSSGAFISDHNTINSDLRDQLRGLRQAVYSTITQYHSFNNFSNDGGCGQTPVSSIETPHNAIHNAMNPGHMSPPATSAFDPLFWLHHSNVDRQIALFENLFPTTYVEPCSAEQITWTTQYGDILDSQSPLTPFHRTASGEWWTSANSRNTWDLGYTYPELLDGPTNETLISRINELYRDSRLASQSKSIQEPTSDVEYMVRIAMPVSSETSYNVVLFLGEVDNEAAKWQSQDSFVSKTSSMIIASAQKSSSTLGTIMLGDVIEKRIADAQLQQEDIVNHLKTNLHWRLELGNVEVPRSQVPGVKVTLMNTAVERATSNFELDRWVGGFKVLGDIE